ncbi:MAG: hypothetical protein KA436_09390 [Oligoflexales bacterium]|nr:hypothetical protein [Oligoflexales bacterium]
MPRLNDSCLAQFSYVSVLLSTVLLLTSIMGTTDLAAYELVEPFYAPRPLGMGGAFTAVANDQSSVWTNPAGLARSKKPKARQHINFSTFPNLVLGTNQEALNFYTDLNSASGGNKEEKVAKSLSGAVQTSGDTSKPLWANLAANPLMFFSSGEYSSNSLGVFSKNTLQISPDATVSTFSRVESVSDVGALLGMAFGNKTNSLNFGLQVRPTVRYSYDGQMESVTLLDKSALKSKIMAEANNGSGVGIDMGLLWTLPDFWFPTFGLAVFNLPTGCVNDELNPFSQKRETICGMKFSGTVRNQESLYLVEPTDIRLGFSLTPRFDNKIAMKIAIDLQHLYISLGSQSYGLPGVEASKLLHAGLEIFLGNPLQISPFALRVGYGQGFVSAGISLRIKFLAIEFATFGRDISSTSSPKEDRRSLVSVSAEY